MDIVIGEIDRFPLIHSIEAISHTPCELDSDCDEQEPFCALVTNDICNRFTWDMESAYFFQLIYWLKPIKS
jgi:hypothetical protein